jgi:hypothetical protein
MRNSGSGSMSGSGSSSGSSNGSSSGGGEEVAVTVAVTVIAVTVVVAVMGRDLLLLSPWICHHLSLCFCLGDCCLSLAGWDEVGEKRREGVRGKGEVR